MGMDDLENVIQKAGQLYEGNYHCCEAIVLAVSEYMGMSSGLLQKIATPFGGGMTSNGAACGSLIAAYLCLGAIKGRSMPGESRSSCCEPADRIFQKFQQTYGSCNCRQITGFDKKDQKAAELLSKKVKDEICVPMVKEVTRWILEELKTDD
jgi:C_GCAxxG_C_C family probable redox protein